MFPDFHSAIGGRHESSNAIWAPCSRECAICQQLPGVGNHEFLTWEAIESQADEFLSRICEQDTSVEDLAVFKEQYIVNFFEEIKNMANA